MSNYTTLIGAEDVRAAGSAMSRAAEQMLSAAMAFETVMERHQRFLDDWLIRFTEAMQTASPAGGTIRPAQDKAMKASPVTAQPAVGTASSLIADRARDLIAKMTGFEIEKVTDAASWGDLGCDSLDTVELVMAFEEEFGIEIPDEDAEDLILVKDAIRYIERAKGGA